MYEEDYGYYYKKRYTIAFYQEEEDGDERFVAGFDNPVEICKYKKLELNDRNLSLVKVELCRALKRLPPTTRMLDGTTMKVYLIDIFQDEDEEDRLEQERRDKCMATKKFVQITSTINLEVYASLEAIQVIRPGNQSGNLMNAKSGWAKIRVLITSGTSWYPSEILNWDAIKALAGKEIITVGAQSDTISNPEVLKKAEEQAAAIAKGKKDLEVEKARMKASNAVREEEVKKAKEEQFKLDLN